MFYGIFFGLMAIVICLYCLFKFNVIKPGINEKCQAYIDKGVKIAVIALVIISFIDVFLPDAFAIRYIQKIIVDGKTYESFEYLKEFHNPLHAILRAFNAMAVITLPFAVIYRKPNFIRVACFVLLPMTLVNAAFYFQYIEYFTSSLTSYAPVFGDKLLPILTNRAFRSIWFGLIMGLQLLICAYLFINEFKNLKFENKKEIGRFFALFGALFFSNMPIYTIQQITGNVTNLTFNFGDPMHFVFIACIAIECVILTLIFKNKSYEDKYVLLLIMAISLMFQYNTFFKTDGNITATRYPLQLCNIAGLFILITLLIKSEKMFHFAAVVNVTGAIIAIALCDSTKDTGILYCMNIHYMVEHVNVFLTPLLGLILGVFKPFKVRDVKHFIIGFTIYYVCIFFIGTILNGLEQKTGNSYFNCNYLFMFQKAAATRLVGNWIGTCFDIGFTIGKYYHVYLAQLLVYIVFLGICTGIFFALWAIFKNKANKSDNDSSEEFIEPEVKPV